MPIGDVLHRRRTQVNRFQLSEGYSHLPPLPPDLHEYFTGLTPFVVEHANDFDLLSAFQWRSRRRGEAKGTKGELELFFEIGIPPAKSLRSL
jgi:hypothetical protein